MTSWIGRDLDSVLADLQKRAQDVLRQKPSGVLPVVLPDGYAEEEIAAHERSIGRPIPEPVRKLYLSAGGIDWHGEDLQFGASYLRALHVSGWVDTKDYDELSDLGKAWERDDYFEFAQTVYGDTIVFCEHPPGHPSGSIILIDHECCNQVRSKRDPQRYTSIVFLADNLAEWLARWLACDFEEYAATPGDCTGQALDYQIPYLEDHIRLNPTVGWATERLAELRKQR